MAEPGPEGCLVVDKPAGWTSHDVVARCRRVLGTRRVGHAGTLDPDATGVLVLGVGRGTRLLRFAGLGTKRYVGEVVLGVTTSTLDASGEVTSRREVGGVGLEELRHAALGLTGRILQAPPMVSAVKVGGRRLHELARAGVEVDRRPRPVVVQRFEVYPGSAPDRVLVLVECSSGTYVRVLAADLGEAVGCGAHLGALRRVAVGSFTDVGARTLAEVETEGPGALEPLAALVRDLDRTVVDDALCRLVGTGRVLERSALGVAGPGPWAVVDEGGRLLAVYESAGPERARPAVVLETAGPGAPDG